MSNRLKRKKPPKKSPKKYPICHNYFDGLLLHLQRSDCAAIARNVNVPNAPQNIAFHHRARDDDEEEDESNWEMNLHHEEAVMEQNDKDDETCADVLHQNLCESDGEGNGVNDSNFKNPNENDDSDYESFHDEMDWYHVLNCHGCQSEKVVAVPAVLDEN